MRIITLICLLLYLVTPLLVKRFFRAKIFRFIPIIKSLFIIIKVKLIFKTYKFKTIMWKDYLIRPICDIAAGLIFGALALWIGSNTSDGLSIFLVMLFSALGATVMDLIWRMVIAKVWQ